MPRGLSGINPLDPFSDNAPKVRYLGQNLPDYIDKGLGYALDLYDILKDYPVQPLSDWCLQHPLYFFSNDAHNSPGNSPSAKKKRMGNGKHGGGPIGLGGGGMARVYLLGQLHYSKYDALFL